MKQALLLALLGFSMTPIYADTVPSILSSQYIATARYNGSSISYAENRYGNGPLADVAAAMIQVPTFVESALNAAFTDKASSSGGTFLSGSLVGSPTVVIAPQNTGITLISLNGWNYTGSTRFSGRKFGIISYDCVNTLTLRNFGVTAQYGSQNGQMIPDKVGATGDVSSSTECDSNISWILPFVGDFIIGQITSRLDSRLVSGAQAALGKVKDKLLFDRGSNFISGLNKLVPVDKVIPLPNGGSFALGQYIQNNLPYLIGNSQLTLKLGQGVPQLRPILAGQPGTTTETGSVLDLSLTSPVFSFGVGLIEKAQVAWTWVCSAKNPAKQCQPDY